MPAGRVGQRGRAGHGLRRDLRAVAGDRIDSPGGGADEDHASSGRDAALVGAVDVEPPELAAGRAVEGDDAPLAVDARYTISPATAGARTLP